MGNHLMSRYIFLTQMPKHHKRFMLFYLSGHNQNDYESIFVVCVDSNSDEA